MELSLVIGLCSLVVFVLGLYAAGIGFFGLSRVRPLVVSTRLFIWMLFLSFLPVPVVYAMTMYFIWGGGPDYLVVLLVMIALTIIVELFSRKITGYMIFGVHGKAFRSAIVSVLKKNNIPYQEMLSRIRLTEIKMDLCIETTSLTKTTVISTKGGRYNEHIKKIAHAINEYYKTATTRTNYAPYVIYSISGIVALIVSAVFISELAKAVL